MHVEISRAWVYIQYNTHAWGKHLGHTLTPQRLQNLQAFGPGQVSPLQFPLHSSWGSPFASGRLISGGCSSPLFICTAEMVKVSPARKEGENEGYPAFRPERVTQCMGETRTLSKLRSPAGTGSLGSTKQQDQAEAVGFCLAWFYSVCSPFHPPASQPPQTWEGQILPRQSIFFKFFLPCHLPGSPRSAS